MNISKIIHLKDDETVLRVARNSWLVHAPRLALGFLLVVSAFFLMYPLLRFGYVGLGVFLVSVLAGTLVGCQALVFWYWNVFIVTDRRLVDVDQRGFFRRSVAEAPYEKVRDVTYSVNGLVRSLLRLGSVRAETDGSFLELRDVHDPRGIHQLITETAGRRRAHGADGAPGSRVTELLATVAELNDTEAKAFLVAIQQAVTNGRPSGAADEERRRAADAWAESAENPSAGGVFREDVVED